MKLLACFGILFFCGRTGRADGGSMLVQGNAGPWRVSLFVSSLPLRVGPVDFSVLLQDARTLEPVLDADVTLRLQNRALRLTHERAATRILYAGAATVASEGAGQVTLVVRRGDASASISTDVTVQPAINRFTSYAVPFAVVPLAIILFLLNQSIRKRVRRPVRASRKTQARFGK